MGETRIGDGERGTDATRGGRNSCSTAACGTLVGEWAFNVMAQGTLVKCNDFAKALDAMDAKRQPL